LIKKEREQVVLLSASHIEEKPLTVSSNPFQCTPCPN
jgi:hypothetical protein